jgi:hypothetical protein
MCCAVAFFVWETFLQLLVLFDVFPTLCKMSVNGVVARVPVVRSCLSSDNCLCDGHVYLLLLFITVLPFSSEYFTSHLFQRTDEAINSS